MKLHCEMQEHVSLWSNRFGDAAAGWLRERVIAEWQVSGQRAECTLCGSADRLVAAVLGICGQCLRERPDDATARAAEVHASIRDQFGLPPSAPSDPEGAACGRCVNACRLLPEQVGLCGARVGSEGGVINRDQPRAAVSWYHDPLPTNCVADWVCPGSAERGRANLAVFYGACTFDCLFCQNWHFRHLRGRGELRTAEELAAAVDDRTACICYFGGDPTPAIDHAIAASHQALETTGGRVRICWETNGAMSRALLREVTALSAASGGCVKFDLKAWSEPLHLALTGASNRATIANFEWLMGEAQRRPESPLAIASTLLVPGYVESEEVSAIARFIASVDPTTPYALLAFHPDFVMTDLPITDRALADACLSAAREAGLTRVRLGNIHLL